MSGSTSSIALPAGFPPSYLVPGVYIGNSPFGSPAGESNTILLIGDKIITGPQAGTGALNMPVLAVNQANVNLLAGPGSPLANMYATCLLNNSSATYYIAPVTAVGGTATVYNMVVTGPATGAGTLSFLIGGFPVNVAVKAGYTNIQIVGAINAAVNSSANLAVPFNASQSTPGTCTLTATTAGATSGALQVILNPGGAAQNQSTPPGVTVTITQTTVGAGTPDLAALITNLNNHSFNYYIHPYVAVPYNSTTDEDVTETSAFLGLEWTPIVDGFGTLYSAAQGSVTQLAALTGGGVNMNDPYTTIMSVPVNSPSPSYLWAAAYGSQAAFNLASDPSLPLTGRPMYGVSPAPIAQNFADSDRQTLYTSGIASYKVENGIPYINLDATTYLLNSQGVPDNSYSVIRVAASLQYVSTTFKQTCGARYQFKKIVKDPAVITGFNNLVTPNIIKADLIGVYADLCNQGICADLANFSANIQVQISAPGRVTAYLPITLASGLEQIVLNQVFALQS